MGSSQLLSKTVKLLRKIRSTLVVFILLSANTGCADSMRFIYISLENVDGIQVERRDKPKLQHTLLMGSKFPTHYRLNRPEYVLDFTIATDKFSPHVWVQAIKAMGGPLRIQSRADRLPKAGRVYQCGTYSDTNPTEKLRFDWTICSSDAEPEEMVFAFDVIEADGTVVGIEDVPFHFVNNGFYFSPDGP